MADLINSLDLNLLKVFRAVFHTQSTVRASGVLNVSQPAISRALNKLRASFNDPLFEWRGNRMAPTSLAQAIQPEVETALLGAEMALAHVHKFDPQTTNMNFTLGLTDYAIFAVFPQLFRRIRKEAPHVSINLRSVNAFDALRQLDEGRVEFAIVSHKVNDANFSAEELFQEDYSIVGDPQFVAVPTGQIMPLRTYLSLSHALCSYGGGRRGWVDEELENLGLKRNIQFVFDAFSPMIANLRYTNLLATVPSRLVPFAEETFGLSHWKLPFPSMRHAFHLVMRRQHRPTPARAWFRQTMLSIANEGPETAFD